MALKQEAEKLHNAINYTTYLTEEEFTDAIAKRMICTITTIVIICGIALIIALVCY